MINITTPVHQKDQISEKTKAARAAFIVSLQS